MRILVRYEVTVVFFFFLHWVWILQAHMRVRLWARPGRRARTTCWKPSALRVVPPRAGTEQEKQISSFLWTEQRFIPKKRKEATDTHGAQKLHNGLELQTSLQRQWTWAALSFSGAIFPCFSVCNCLFPCFVCDCWANNIFTFFIFLQAFVVSHSFHPPCFEPSKIGRASCRERVSAPV